MQPGIGTTSIYINSLVTFIDYVESPSPRKLGLGSADLPSTGKPTRTPDVPSNKLMHLVSSLSFVSCDIAST